LTLECMSLFGLDVLVQHRAPCSVHCAAAFSFA
jgi:hypothetical protein